MNFASVHLWIQSFDDMDKILVMATIAFTNTSFSDRRIVVSHDKRHVNFSEKKYKIAELSGIVIILVDHFNKFSFSFMFHLDESAGRKYFKFRL